ncbi:hypothetical protein [Bacillus cereus]|uniref:hypothetical protein n=1 Tax=Bacillus cereus TaxID=1396 RepID=UPI002AC13936|nr:hypothetical protein [Bacillus cereus]MDZ4496908.1 hypothetical protein [Bacillus cereus]MDZ4519228.1 hypothetical protein [Bacillus cereus]
MYNIYNINELRSMEVEQLIKLFNEEFEYSQNCEPGLGESRFHEFLAELEYGLTAMLEIIEEKGRS